VEETGLHGENPPTYPCSGIRTHNVNGRRTDCI